jgi:hypothetical protein
MTPVHHELRCGEAQHTHEFQKSIEPAPKIEALDGISSEATLRFFHGTKHSGQASRNREISPDYSQWIALRQRTEPVCS